jgi:tetratricopeptide (TPR) repeat protein
MFAFCFIACIIRCKKYIMTNPLHKAVLFYILFLWMLPINQVHASGAQRKATAHAYNGYQRYYEAARGLNDTSGQISGLLGMLSVRQDDTFALKTLSFLYLAKGNTESALISASNYLKLKPEDIEVIKVQGAAMQMAHDFQRAIIVYTELFYRTKEPQFKYLQAYMEYELFRQAEALRTIDDCMRITASETTLMQIKYNDGTSDWIPVKAACLNLRGLVYMDMKEIEKAKMIWEEAIRMYPDFQLAKDNLSNLTGR